VSLISGGLPLQLRQKKKAKVHFKYNLNKKKLQKMGFTVNNQSHK
jgi:hypothetical protein